MRPPKVNKTISVHMDCLQMAEELIAAGLYPHFSGMVEIMAREEYERRFGPLRKEPPNVKTQYLNDKHCPPDSGHAHSRRRKNKLANGKV